MNSAYRQLVATYKTQQYYLELYADGVNPEYKNALAHWTGVLNHQARQLQVNVKFLPTEIELLEHRAYCLNAVEAR